ncbi:MAG: HAD family hydrolase [Cyclobacteriaceae bacterium]
MAEFGIIFDMDGVLVNNNQYHYQAWKAICDKYQKPIEDDVYRDKMNGRTLKALVSFIFGEEQSNEKTLAVGHEKEALYRSLYQPYMEPAEGLFPILSAAYQNKIPMIVGTSAPKENVRFIIDGLGIGHYFTAILDDRSVINGKPNPEIYLKCAKAAGLPNDKCVVIEDAVSGLQAAAAAGSKTIALTTSHSKDELSADLIIDSFKSLDLKKMRELIFK